MDLKTLNPMVHVRNWFDTAQKKESAATDLTPVSGQTAVLPETDQSKDAEIVMGTFVPAGADQLYTESSKQTEHFARVVEQFDEDKQEPIEWLIWKCAAIFCYIAPFALAIPIGLSIGDVFTNPLPGKPVSPFMQTWSANTAIHMLSLFLEVLMPILGLTTVLAFKRALKDKRAISGFIMVGFFFLTVSVGNALALFFLLEKGMQLDGRDPMAIVVTLGRSFGPLILDVGSAVALSVYAKKSLEKYLIDQQKKIEATRRVNDVHVAMEQTKIKAAIDRQTAIMDMQTKQQRANTWNELERIQSQAMIDQARCTMGGGDSNERGRYGGW